LIKAWSFGGTPHLFNFKYYPKLQSLVPGVFGICFIQSPGRKLLISSFPPKFKFWASSVSSSSKFVNSSLKLCNFSKSFEKLEKLTEWEFLLNCWGEEWTHVFVSLDSGIRIGFIVKWVYFDEKLYFLSQGSNGF